MPRQKNRVVSFGSREKSEAKNRMVEKRWSDDRYRGLTVSACAVLRCVLDINVFGTAFHACGISSRKLIDLSRGHISIMSFFVSKEQFICNHYIHTLSLVVGMNDMKSQ